MRGRRLAGRSVAILAVMLAGCSEVLDPAGSDLPIALGLALDAAAGGSAEAYAAVDAIAVTVRVGGTVVFDETQAFTPETGETRVRVRLERTLAGSTVTVEATLLGGTAPLFQGAGSTTLEESGPTELTVALMPVVSGVVVADPVASFTAIGETLPLSAAAVFATGDTVPNVPVTWRSLDPTIVTVGAGGSATSRAEGTARLEASAGGATASTTATVVADVAVVSVSPPAATVSVGESATFAAQAFDRNSNPLTRTFAWSSSNTAVATVTAAGVATGVTSGVANIVASANGTQGSAVLTVVDVPIAPENLTGTILDEGARTYRLTWEDRSTNETYFAVEWRPGGGSYVEIAQVAADVTQFEASATTIGDSDFRVLACNAVGCSPPSNVVRLTFVGGPPVATTLESPDIGVMAGTVTGASPYTVRFQYGYDPDDFLDNGECPCYEETSAGSGSGTEEFTVPVELWSTDYPVYYRIVAENEFGESVGSIESASFPSVRTTASPTIWDYGSSVTFGAELFVPGSGGNPISSVTFEVNGFVPPYGAVLSDGTASTSTSGTGTIYSYSRTWRAPDSDNEIGGSLIVYVIVAFESGASAYAPSLFLSQGTAGVR